MSTLYHVHLRSPKGGEVLLPRKFRSLASAMRWISRVEELSGNAHIDEVKQTDYTVHLEPCEDTCPRCRDDTFQPHYHARLRTPEGGDHTLPRRFRSLASAIRHLKRIQGYVTIDGVQRDDYTVSMEPCEDRWSKCRHILAKEDAQTIRQLSLL